jgi:hypothetical protein
LQTRNATGPSCGILRATIENAVGVLRNLPKEEVKSSVGSALKKLADLEFVTGDPALINQHGRTWWVTSEQYASWLRGDRSFTSDAEAQADEAKTQPESKEELEEKSGDAGEEEVEAEADFEFDFMCNECPVCLEEMDSETHWPIPLDPCGHLLCKDCAAVLHICPVCRTHRAPDSSSSSSSSD